MVLQGDYHTHTIYTHGHGTVEDSVKVAIKRGLKQIAITEHSFSQAFYGINKKEYNEMRVEIESLRRKYKGRIDILCGLESNLLDLNGNIDLPPEERKIVDILVVGYHANFKPRSLKAFFTFWIPNVLGIGGKSKKQIAKNTEAYTKAIKKNKIDIISHLNSHRCYVDPVKIAKVAKEYNTYIELNGKVINFSDEQMEDMIATGVKFIIDSDAHYPDRVGKNHRGMNFVEKYNIPPEQVANLDKIPKFKTFNLDKE